MISKNSSEKVWTDLVDDEVTKLIEMLHTDLAEPFSFHGLSFRILFSIIKDLARNLDNLRKLVEKDIPSVLSELSERLAEDNQAIATELIWALMQDEVADELDITAAEDAATCECL